MEEPQPRHDEHTVQGHALPYSPHSPSYTLSTLEVTLGSLPLACWSSSSSATGPSPPPWGILVGHRTCCTLLRRSWQKARL